MEIMEIMEIMEFMENQGQKMSYGAETTYGYGYGYGGLLLV